ncbi:MAG: hypothetical protein IKF42_04280 [Mogibacterium sp.]|nr:hypothetical protein [Mogibacterium sp.]
MANEYKNKVVYGGNTLIDLTGDTVERSDVASGKTFHLPSGEITTGTSTKDADTSDATAVASEILIGSTAYARGSKVTGTMPNNGAVSGVISDADDVYTVPIGFHDGSGTVVIAASEVAKLKNHSNIKNGVTILGETGTYSGEAASVQSNKNATPSASQQIITPDSGYDYLAQVTVLAIPYTETLNAAGGLTVTIG